MTRTLFFALACWWGTAVAAQGLPTPHWTPSQVHRLVSRLNAAADDGLGSVTPLAKTVQAAMDNGEPLSIDIVATAAAKELLDAYRQGCCNASLRTRWHIPDENWGDTAASVAAAVSANSLETLFTAARPSHPFYSALRAAFAREQDPARRATLAANLDRWRWMPRKLGARYLLVNTAAFEATLWEGQQMVGRWRVVVGKTKSPTPVFQATVTGVILNPWWEIPPSIAAEGVAALVRGHPAEAAAKGYVETGGRYRQRPGASNALGRMKLVMPNAYNVYLHDTPAQALFAQDVRAYSHGCVRVGDALGLANALLASQPGWSRKALDAAVASGKTTTIPLDTPIPVFVAYFTAEPDSGGGIHYLADIYHRDIGAKAPDIDGRCTR